MSTPSPLSFLEFVRKEAAELRSADQPPATLAAWKDARDTLRRNLSRSWGPFPDAACELAPKKLGELDRGDVIIEKLAFQTLPDVWMTANAYVPKRAGKLPAVLHVHGHWKGAKQDPHVHARAMGLAKLGFFSLAVDAFGAGERGLATKLGEYHGEMIAATLWPTGLSLAGVQVYENMRAVDYLLTRAEVDGERIGITGASGGGNQSMYAGAWDDRFKAVVPVCSVGNYQAYLGVACCMCEVIPGALRFTEEWGVLSLIAPRALLVINASKDSIQFSIAEAEKSLKLVRPVFQLHGREAALKHANFESPHDYNQPMREAMYGWMKLHLAGEGDGGPVAEPEFMPEDPETLRCYPDDSRPADFVTIPKFAARVAEQVMARRDRPDHREFWESEAFLIRESLDRLLGGWPLPEAIELTSVAEEADVSRTFEFTSEPGLRLTANQRLNASKRWVVLAHAEGREAGEQSEYATAFHKAGWQVICPELRATGSHAVKGDGRTRAPDHNSAEWSLWLGRPLVGQWAFDLTRALEAALQAAPSLPDEVLLVGLGPASIAALLAAAYDERFTRLALVEPLLSYRTEIPYERERMASMIPGVLRFAGDIAHVAALLSPRPLLVAGGVLAAGKPLDVPEIESRMQFVREIYLLQAAAARCTLAASLRPTEFVERIG